VSRDVQHVEGQPLVVEPVVPEQVAPKLGGADEAPVGSDRSIQSCRQERLDVPVGLREFVLEPVLRERKFALGPQQLVLDLDQVGHLELVLGDLAELPESPQLGVIELARLGVGDAERADFESARPAEGTAGIEANAGLIHHQGVVAKALVDGGVGDHQRLVLEDGVATERDVATGLVHRQAALGLEPLPVGIDQRHVRRRHLEHRRGQLDQAIEAFLGRRVQKP